MPHSQTRHFPPLPLEGRTPWPNLLIILSFLTFLHHFAQHGFAFMKQVIYLVEITLYLQKTNRRQLNCEGGLFITHTNTHHFND